MKQALIFVGMLISVTICRGTLAVHDAAIQELQTDVSSISWDLVILQIASS